MIYHKLVCSLVTILLTMLSMTVIAEQSLENYYWRAVSIDSEKLVLEAKQIPHIAFHQQTSRVAGFGGCNRFFATYDRKNTALKISVMGGGRASCSELEGLEHRFLQLLHRTRSFKIEGAALFLMDGDEVLGEFLGVKR